MIKNVRLKVLLQDTVFVVLSEINKRKQHNPKVIMLYSNLGFRDNIKALYDYLIKEKYYEKYTIVCSTNDYKIFESEKYPNVKFISNVAGVKQYFSAGYVFYCFGKLPILPGKQQEVTQIWHGTPFKAADKGVLEGHSWKKHYYTHVVSPAHNFDKIMSHWFSMPVDSMIVDGYPRCDALFEPSPNYDFGKYKKLILWAPTFRKSKITGYSDVKNVSDNILPVVSNDKFIELNSYLKERGFKLVAKLHPLQDIDYSKLKELDHLVLLSHKQFTDRGMDLYRLMKQADALITDYSSIFFDYLLLDRPIGFTEDDMNDYGDDRGFEVDDVDAYRPGEKIKTMDDLKLFIDHIANNIDGFESDRQRVIKLSNDYTKGGYSKRLLDVLGIIK